MLSQEFKNALKKSIGLATPSTKELILSSVNSDIEKFPKLLAKYNWSGTRDLSMALIIIAFYAYCANNSNDPILKAFPNMIKQNGTNHHKLLENLKKGNGTGIINCMGKNFDDTLDYVLQKALPCDTNDEENNSKNQKARSRVIKNFKNRAKKITPWVINKASVENLINKLLGTVPDESEVQAKPANAFEQSLKDDFLKYANSPNSQEPEKAAETLINFLVFCIDNQKIDSNIKSLANKSNINTKGIIMGISTANGEQIKNSCGTVFKNAFSSALKHLGISNDVNTTKLTENFITSLSKIDSKTTLPTALNHKITNLAHYYSVGATGNTKHSTNSDSDTIDPKVELLVNDICKILESPNQNKQTNEAVFPRMEKVVQALKDKGEEIKNKYIQRIKIATKNKPMGKENTCYWDNILEESLKKADGKLYYPCKGLQFTLENMNFKYLMDRIVPGSEVTLMLGAKGSDGFNWATRTAMTWGNNSIKFDEPFEINFNNDFKSLLGKYIDHWMVFKQVHRIVILKVEKAK